MPDGRRRRRRPFLNDLPRRAWLTVRHHGWGELLLRLVTAPLRLVGFERGGAAAARPSSPGCAGSAPGTGSTGARSRSRSRRTATRLRRSTASGRCSRRWTARAPGSWSSTTARPPRSRSGSAPSSPRWSSSSRRRTPASQRASTGRWRRAGPDDDVVILNNDVLPFRAVARAPAARGLRRGARHRRAEAAVPRRPDPVRRLLPEPRRTRVVRPPLSLPALRLTARRTCRATRWRSRARACTSRATRSDALGELDDGYPMGFEDVDYCLRAWEAGIAVGYEPSLRARRTSSRSRAAPRSGSASAPRSGASGTAGATGSTSATCARPTAASGSST